MGMVGGRRLVVVVLLLAAPIGGIVYAVERPHVTYVPFAELPVKGGPEGLGNSPVAPEGFPECTRELLDLHIEDTERHVDVTFRPKPGVQCGIPWSLESWWVDATGKRFDTPRSNSKFEGRLLLMGKAGASDTGGIETACGMTAPITYFIELGGEPIRVGTIEKPECWAKRRRLYPSFLLYRGGGLETPAGWLDASIVAPQSATDRELPSSCE